MAATTSATSSTAEALALGDRIGTIKAGYDADIIAVHGNPVKDIEARAVARCRSSSSSLGSPSFRAYIESWQRPADVARHAGATVLEEPYVS